MKTMKLKNFEYKFIVEPCDPPVNIFLWNKNGQIHFEPMRVNDAEIVSQEIDGADALVQILDS